MNREPFLRPRRPSSNNIPGDLPAAADKLPLDHTIGEDAPFTAPVRHKSSEDLNLVLEWTDDLADSMDDLALHGQGDVEDVSVTSFVSDTTSSVAAAAEQRPNNLRPTESGTSVYSISRPRTILPTDSTLSMRSRGVQPGDSGLMSLCSIGSDKFHVVSPETNTTTANVVLMDCEDDEERLVAPRLAELPARSQDDDDDDDEEPLSLSKGVTTPKREVSQNEDDVSSATGSPTMVKGPTMFGRSKRMASIYRAPSVEQQ